MNQTQPDPSHILQIGMGFFATKTLLSAVELGVFEALAEAPLTAEQLRTRLALHQRAAGDFFDALVALGFLQRAGDGPDSLYANTIDTAAFLVPSSPRYVGGLLKMSNDRSYHHWANLTRGLKTGLPQNELSNAKAGDDAFAAIYTDPQAVEDFANAMAGVQLGNFHALAEKFDFSRWNDICDVGGSSAALSIILAQAYPNLHCISFDLAPVTALAGRRIAAAGLTGRVQARGGDFMKEELPQAGIVIMGNILHDWGTGTQRMLLAKAYNAVRDGGAFIAVETLIDDARRENAFGLLMSLHMMIETPEGYNFTMAHFDQLAREAGFRRTETIALTGPSSAAVAWK